MLGKGEGRLRNGGRKKRGDSRPTPPFRDRAHRSRRQAAARSVVMAGCGPTDTPAPNRGPGPKKKRKAKKIGGIAAEEAARGQRTGEKKVLTLTVSLWPWQPWQPGARSCATWSPRRPDGSRPPKCHPKSRCGGTGSCTFRTGRAPEAGPVPRGAAQRARARTHFRRRQPRVATTPPPPPPGGEPDPTLWKLWRGSMGKRWCSIW